MAQPGFIFGEGTADTYESLQAKRKTAERLGLAAMRTPQNLGEGLSSLGQAIAYRRLMGQADRGDAAGRAASDSAFAQIMAGMGGMGGSGPRVSSSGTWDKAPPPPKPTDLPGMGAQPLSFGSTSRTVDTPAGKQNVTGAPIPGMPQIGGGGLDFGSATMTPQEMLIAGAEARGWNPIDVATAISYETGATMDPMISGPTTQWGTHKGLIQFGEPQAAEHGADFTDPNTAMRSQLDPTNGAVWSYLENAGVKPGMGLDDIYSAINAGAPGRYGASDANNGGAPGTVGDKVAGMGDHRGTAADWLGGTWTPSDNVTVSTQGAAPQGGGASIPALMEAMSDPYASEAQKSVLGMLLQQQLTAMQPQSEEEMLRLQQLRIQTAEMQNPGKKPPIEVNGVLVDADTFQPVYDGRTPEDDMPDGFQTKHMTALAGGLVPGTPEYEAFMVGSDEGIEYGLTAVWGRDENGNPVPAQLSKNGTIKTVDLPPGWTPDPGLTAQMQAEGRVIGDATGTAKIGLEGALLKTKQALDLIDAISTDPALESVTGTFQGGLFAPGIPMITGGQAGTDLVAKTEQLKGKVFVEAFESLKGAGQITETEGAAATAAIGRLNRAQSTPAYQAALAELKTALQDLSKIAQGRAGVTAPSSAPQATHRFNPATGKVEAIQ